MNITDSHGNKVTYENGKITFSTPGGFGGTIGPDGWSLKSPVISVGGDVEKNSQYVKVNAGPVSFRFNNDGSYSQTLTIGPFSYTQSGSEIGKIDKTEVGISLGNVFSFTSTFTTDANGNSICTEKLHIDGQPDSEKVLNISTPEGISESICGRAVNSAFGGIVDKIIERNKTISDIANGVDPDTVKTVSLAEALAKGISESLHFEQFDNGPTLVKINIAGINNHISSLFSSSQTVQPRRDPLTLDLDNDGLETVGISTTNPIMFDHDGDGVKTATGWVKADDAFLVLDRNGNGTIDNGSELFGDSTPLAGGGTAADGFAALAQEDTNNDGMVNASDTRFANLRIWQDTNQDGISQANELKTLAEVGISAISVAKTENSQLLSNGNQLADLGSFIRTDGTTGSMGEVSAQMGDINLIEDSFHSQFTDSIPLTEQAAALPSMNGSGRVRSLQEAASLSPTVASLLTQYTAATTRSQQMALLDQLIIEWGKTSDLAVTGAGAYNGLPTTVSVAGLAIGSEAYDTWITQLQTMERFNGRAFGIPTEGATSITINMFAERKALLNQAYDALRESVYDSLLLQTRLKPYLDAITIDVTENSVTLNFDAMYAKLETLKATDAYNAATDIVEIVHYANDTLASLGARLDILVHNWLNDPACSSIVFAIFQDMGVMCSGNRVGSNESDLMCGQSLNDTLYGEAGNDILFGYGGDDTLNGGSGNDLLDGGVGNDYLCGDAGNDTILGDAGNDQLWSGAGGDILDGGTGNDIIYGNDGSDTYRFGLGSGVDTINNYSDDWSSTTDVIEFGTGIAASDLELRKEGNSLRIVIKGTSDAILINNWFTATGYKVDQFKFADGSMVTAAQLEANGCMIYGTATGNDTLNGTYYNDQIYGYGGDDTLNGGSGNDFLDGGVGNDMLTGGAGNNTYLLGTGYGNDTIIENDSTAGNTDIAQFGNGIATEQLWFSHVGNNLEVSVIGSSDKFTIQNWYSGSAYHVEQFKTSDGKVLLDTQVDALVNAMATFTAPAAGQTTLPDSYRTTLAPVIAANWQ